MLRHTRGKGTPGPALPLASKPPGTSASSRTGWCWILFLATLLVAPLCVLGYSVIIAARRDADLSGTELLKRGALDASQRLSSFVVRARAGAALSAPLRSGRAQPSLVPLIDDAISGEGVRLELVTTESDKNPFPPSFCDHFESASTLMAGPDGALAGGPAAHTPGKGPTCAIVRFWLVDQETPYSDKIVTYIHAHEHWVVELFTGILSATACKPLVNKITYYCRADLDDAFVAGRRLLVADWGANAGYFTQMAARLGYAVSVVEPQPHCIEFIRAATSMNGVGSLVDLHHAFLAKGGRTAEGATSMPIFERTGCFGTFPIPEEKVVRAYYNEMRGDKWSLIPGGNTSVDVPMLDPASLITSNDLVVLLKIDVEGQEVDVLYALEPHLRAKRILNLMVEMNKRSYDPNIEGKFEASFPVFKAVLRYLRDLGYVTLCAQSSSTLSWGDSPIIFSDASIDKFVEDGWMTANIFVALQKGPLPQK